jgi:phage tail protein X
MNQARFTHVTRQDSRPGIRDNTACKEADMSWQTASGLTLCLAFLLVFSILIAKGGRTPPPGDLPANKPDAARDVLVRHDDPPASKPIWIRRAPPLIARIDEPEPTPRFREPTRSTPPDETQTAATTNPPQEPRKYVVKKGDTLSKIARRFFGKDTPSVIELIVRKNNGVIRDRNRIVVGQEILIPLPAAGGADSGVPGAADR